MRITFESLTVIMIKKRLAGSIIVYKLTVTVSKRETSRTDIDNMGQLGRILIQHGKSAIFDLESFVGSS